MSNVTILPTAFELSPSAARAHAMKNCLGVILAICHLTEREIGEKNRARWSHLDAATRRLRDLLAEDPAVNEGHREARAATTSTWCGIGELVALVSRMKGAVPEGLPSAGEAGPPTTPSLLPVAKERLLLAMVRLLADQMDRAIVESDSVLQLSMRLQLAEELELLAGALRAH